MSILQSRGLKVWQTFFGVNLTTYVNISPIFLLFNVLGKLQLNLWFLLWMKENCTTAKPTDQPTNQSTDNKPPNLPTNQPSNRQIWWLVYVMIYYTFKKDGKKKLWLWKCERVSCAAAACCGKVTNNNITVVVGTKILRCCLFTLHQHELGGPKH